MPTKKVTKKPAARRTAAAPKRAMLKVISDPQPAPTPAPMPGPNGSEEARVVYVAACRSCVHVPLGVNAILTVLVAVIFTLSAMLIAASVNLGASQVVADGSASSVASR